MPETDQSRGRLPQVKVANIPGKKVEHQGIKVQLIGQIELATERGHPHDFVSLGAAPCMSPVPSTMTPVHPCEIPCGF